MIKDQPVFHSPIQTKATAARDGDSPVTLEDLSGLPFIVIQGSVPDNLAATGLAVPVPAKPGQVAERDGVCLIWFAADEFYILGTTDQTEPPSVTTLNDQFKTSGTFAYATNLTHGQAVVRLSGVAAPGTLRKICGLDFDDHAFPNLQAKITSAAKVRTMIIRRDSGETPGYYLLVDRPMGQYFWDTVLDAGQEFGITIKK